MARQLAEFQQGPVRSWFPKGENALIGAHTFNVIGSGIFGNKTVPPTGTPTGVHSAGVPDVSATYVATGTYEIRFPPCKSVDIDVAFSSSSGYMFHGQAQNQSGPSGSALLQVTRLGFPGPTGFDPIQASGHRGFLPTGTKVMLQFYAAPTSDGLTSY
jgi:hypothetical protein